MSGSWYDPSHSGEGFLLEVLENNTAVIYWFTYDEAGAQRWFISVGEVASSAAVFDELLLASGPEFGDGFDPGDVVYSDIGELRIQWEDCSQATATYTVNGVQGSQSLYRLSTLAGLDCEAPISSFSTLSGSWFDQTHNGEGLVIEALNDGRVLLFWFSYDDEGKQVWFYGLGEQSGADVSISAMFITSGGRFGPNFDPEQVQHELWGSLQLELGCDFGKFDYASGLPVFGSGKQTLTRLTSPGNPDCEASQPPNILLVIADDLGLDASNQYDISPESPVTPSLDQLANQGLVFENTWSNPSCSPTRAGMLTGKFGTRTGVLSPGDVLSENEVSLQSYIHQHLPGKYTDAVIGKWHLGPRPGGEDHPAALGIGYFAGFTGVGVGHYENWSLTINGQTSTETTYVTSKLVDLAIDWTGGQEKPWFLWLAFNAPHQPYHLPPSYLHSRELSGTKSDIAADPLPYYLAAIEAMDTEIGRLLDSFDEQTRVNTIVIFVGDNGTHEEVAQLPYSKGKAKRSLYQGGINVPLLISGPGVKRIGERESALVNTTDLFSTIAALTGVNVDRVNDSISFENLLGEEQEPERLIQYSERSTSSGEEWTLSDGIYKLIESSEGRLQLYELSEDPFENTDLVGAGIAPIDVLEDLQFLAHQIKSNGAPQ
jgi:arylsulfatase A-like enzyme